MEAFGCNHLRHKGRECSHPSIDTVGVAARQVSKRGMAQRVQYYSRDHFSSGLKQEYTESN